MPQQKLSPQAPAALGGTSLASRTPLQFRGVNGAYRWSVLCASLVIETEGGLGAATVSFTNDNQLEMLLFTSDIPHKVELSGELPNAVLADLFAAVEAATNWERAFATWWTAFVAANPTLTFPASFPAAPSEYVAPGSFILRAQGFGFTAPLSANWAPVSWAKGTGSQATATVGTGLNETTVQGFPVRVRGQSFAPGADIVQLSDLFALVTTDSGVLSGAPAALANAPQPAFVPVVLFEKDYSPAIRDAGNVIIQGDTVFQVVGLWSVTTPTPPVG